MTTLTYKKRVLLGSVAIGAMLVAPTASAQVLDEIIVTAQKREQAATDVPISIQSLDGDLLDESNIYDLSDVAERIPNVTFSATPGFPSIFIRGAGTGSVNNSAEQSVGMFIDGVYVSRGFQFSAPFMDSQSIEVVKGPQGVLQGKNSIAGAVLINSKRPGDEPDGHFRATYEIENQGYGIEGAATVPIMEGWNLRVAAQTNFEGGWLDTTSRTGFGGEALAGREDQNTNEFSAVRVSSTFNVSDDLELYVKLEAGESSRKGVAFGPYAIQPGAMAGPLPIEALFGILDPNFGFIQDGVVSNGYFLQEGTNGPFAQYQPTNREHFQDVKNKSGLFQFDWDVGNLGTVTGISGYTEYDVEAATSNTMSPTDWLTSRNRDGEKTEVADQFTQEIRLVSPGDQTIDYVVGGFYMDRNLLREGGGSAINLSNSFLANVFGAGFPPGFPLQFLDAESVDRFEENTKSFSLFGQLTYNASEDLRVNVGARYSDETKEADFVNASLFPNVNPMLNPITLNIFGITPFTTADLPESKISESNFDPSISIQYDASDDIMVYGSFTRATKAGGFNEGAGTPATSTFDEETADGFEAGMKGSFMDGRLGLNLAAFHTKFSDLQVSALDNSSGAPTFIFQNAAEATSKGIEADFRFAATEELELGGAVGYLDAKYNDFPGAGCSVGISREADCDAITDSRNAAGDKLRFAPEITGSVYADYRKTLSNGMVIGLRGDVQYRDDAFIAAQNDPFLMQDAFAKIDGLVSVTSPSGLFTVSVVGKNLTDKQTSSFAGPTPFFDGAYWANVETPRQIFVNLQTNF